MSNNNTKIISVVNQKGGVGKTTTVMNLGAVLSAINKKVLVIDLDPQGNASTGLGLDLHARKKSIYDVVINDQNIGESIFETKVPNLHIIASTMDLAAAEFDLANLEKREHKLKQSLDNLKYEYDYIFIDCPPSLGLLTINALSASHSLLIPLQCEFFALEGLTSLLDTADRIKDKFNTNLEIDGIILTMYDKRNKLTSQIEKDARNCLGKMIYETVIPRNVRLSEAPSYGVPAILYASNCSGSVAYMDLAEEMIKRNKRSKTK
jgi:chromosome partitioning protein